jgi:hypothetical protein
MLRRLLIAPLTVGVLCVTATAASATTPQGPQNGKHCGQPVGFAIVGGTPAEDVTTNENQQVAPTIPGLGTFTETTCANTLTGVTTIKIVNIKTGACLQFNPLAPKGSPLIAGSNVLIVIGNPFSKGGHTAIYSGTCRTLIPQS